MYTSAEPEPLARKAEPETEPATEAASGRATSAADAELPQVYDIDLDEEAAVAEAPAAGDAAPSVGGGSEDSHAAAPSEGASDQPAEPADPPADAAANAHKPDLSLVERSRTSVLQFLTLVIMVTLGVILFVAAQKGMGLEIPLLAIVALCACLYALARERALREEQHAMTVQLIARERQMTRMHRRISEERERSEVLWNRLDEITSLYRAISAIKAAEDPAQAMSTVVRAACELVGADCGSLQLLDETKSVLSVEATEGTREEVLGATQGAEEGVAGWVLRNEEVLLLTGRAYEDPRFDHTFDSPGVPVECSVAVPLTWHGEAFGVLNVGLSEGSAKTTFDQHEQSLVRIFAEHAALVVVGNRELRRRTLGTRKLRP